MAETRYLFETISQSIENESISYNVDDFNFLNLEVSDIKQTTYFKMISEELSNKQLETLAKEVFSDEVIEDCYFQNYDIARYFNNCPSWVVDVSFLPGVTDNPAKSAQEAVKLVLGKEQIQCFSGRNLFIWGDLKESEVFKISKMFFANELIEKVKIMSFSDFQKTSRFTEVSVPKVQLKDFSSFNEVDLNKNDEELMAMSEGNVWALSLNEMKTIRDYYQETQNKSAREIKGLPQTATNVEMEILAQTWSEHCKHKIFAANIEYSENTLDENMPKLGEQKVEGLYKTLIKGATFKIQNEDNVTWAISVFSDNAGIVRFSDKVDLSIKVETHNSPSALDPYGGALTGIVGVNRDILGVGLGSRPIANTNVLCFAPPTWPTKDNKRELPIGLHHPKRVLQGVHKGIEDGGNKSGIPTVNGALYFDYNYAGKPLVYCGTVGVLPQCSSTGKELAKKYHRAGDRVVMVGGRIGVDGIHGATFSSMELDEKSPSTAVQIGDPLTQKRVTDFMMKAQELELYSSVTDNGAGGLSSSVGEMAEKTNGAKIDVSLAPTKYPGVAPFELIISESQERMTFAVPEENLDEFLALAKKYDVEATDLGAFNDSGFFEILYKNRTVALLEMDFLHNGLEKMNLSAVFKGEQFHSFKEERKEKIQDSQEFIKTALLKLLESPNIRSKEQWVRSYDQEVQAATLVKPFVGQEQKGPGNSGVIWLGPHGGDDHEAVAIGCGLNPRLSYYDTYLMTQYAIDEAVRNLVCQGADPNKIALVDNFCWPDPIKKQSNPDGDHKLAQLVRSCQGLYDMACAYKMPFVSGKDSMKNDFIGKFEDGENVKISVPPTLLITAMGYVPQVDKIITSDFKNVGDYIFHLGKLPKGLKYSEFHRYFDVNSCSPDYINASESLTLYQKIFKAIQKDLLNSCHDISDGGALVAIAESIIGSGLGAHIEIEKDLDMLFSEQASRFIVSVSEKNLSEFKQIFADQSLYLGKVEGKNMLMKMNNDEVEVSNDELERYWRKSW